jgi:phage terminase small subunit
VSSLNDRQRKFCHELLKGKSQLQAAISAGYSKASAQSQAWELLRNPKVSKYLSELKKKTEGNAIMTGSEVLQMLTKIATKAPKSSDCLKALDLLGKHHKLFTELHESQTTFTVMKAVTRNGKPVKYDVGEDPNE